MKFFTKVFLKVCFFLFYHLSLSYSILLLIALMAYFSGVPEANILGIVVFSPKGFSLIALLSLALSYFQSTDITNKRYRFLLGAQLSFLFVELAVLLIYFVVPVSVRVSQGYQDKKILDNAIKEQNPTMCESESTKFLCVLSIATKQNNVEICKNAEFKEVELDTCIWSVSKSNDNYLACEAFNPKYPEKIPPCILQVCNSPTLPESEKTDCLKKAEYYSNLKK